MHANIKSSDSSASHHSQRQKNLYKNITLGKQNSIASLHSSKLSVSTVLLHPKKVLMVFTKKCFQQTYPTLLA